MRAESANKLMQLDRGVQSSTPALRQQFRDAYDTWIVLTHEYFRVDAAIVWTMVRNELPDLRAQLVAFMAGGFENSFRADNFQENRHRATQQAEFP